MLFTVISYLKTMIMAYISNDRRFLYIYIYKLVVSTTFWITALFL